MISKKTMWKVITVTMVTLAVAILITAVGGAFVLVQGLLPSDNGGGDSGGDTKAPVITADSDTVIIYTGDNVSFRSFVKVSDNSGEECEIKIESNVDQYKTNDASNPYTVKITAIDPSGNKSKPFTLNVIVKDAQYSLDNLMQLIEQKAQTELGYTKSTVGNRTKVQIVQDIYNYVKDPKSSAANANIVFDDKVSNAPNQFKQNGDKHRKGWEIDWIEEAYLTLTMSDMKGDCYTYYSVSKAFFEYFGIENQGIERAPGSAESGTHYWHIVKVESGWYYYDSTRLGGKFSSDNTSNSCLITEAKLQSYVTSSGGTTFYAIDKWQGFPEISKTPIN